MEDSFAPVCSLLRRMLEAGSESEIFSLLVNAPDLDAQQLLFVCRNGEKLGFPEPEAQRLRERCETYAGFLLALSGAPRPDVPAAHYGMIGAALRQRGELDRASHFYQLALGNAKELRDRTLALNGMGLLAMQRERLEESQRYLLEACQLCENEPSLIREYLNVLANLGSLAFEKQNIELARHLFERAAGGALTYRLPGEYLLACSRLAELLGNTGQYEPALAVLDEIEPFMTVAPPAERSRLHRLREGILARP